MKLSDNATAVFRGFLNLPNLDKLSVVEAINAYFDSNDREPIRVKCDLRFAQISTALPDWKCVCCGTGPQGQNTPK